MFVLSKPIEPGGSPVQTPSVVPVSGREHGDGYLLFTGAGVGEGAPGVTASIPAADRSSGPEKRTDAPGPGAQQGDHSPRAATETQILADAITQMVWVADTVGNCEFINRPWLEYTGGDFDAQLGWGWTDAIHLDDRPRLGEFWANALNAVEAGRTEGRIRRHDGEYRWFEVRAVPRRDAEGVLTGWYGSLCDIHDKYALERSLVDAQAQVQCATSFGTMASYSYQFDSRVFVGGPGLDELLGTDVGQLAAMGFDRFAELVHPDDKVRWQLTVGKAFDVDSPEFSVEYRVAAAEGGWRWVCGRGCVSFDHDARPVSLAGIVTVLPPALIPDLD